LLLLLWARILVFAGQGCIATAAAPAPAPAAVSGFSQAAAGTSAAAGGTAVQSRADAACPWPFVRSACVAGLQALQQLLPAVQLPGAAGSEEACAAAHQQLQQQCTQLLQQLGHAAEPSSS
jgi:hypothetical protein